MTAVNPCDAFDERLAAGHTARDCIHLDEEQVVTAIRAACRYLGTAEAARRIRAGDVYGEAAAEAGEAFRSHLLAAAALHCDDMLVAHPTTTPDIILKTTAGDLLALAAVLIRAAKDHDGDTFEPARVAMGAYQAAVMAASAPRPESSDDMFGFRKPGTLRATFEEQMQSEGFAPSDMPEPFPLTQAEIAALLDSPEALEALADYHDFNEAQANGMDYAGPEAYHRERGKAFRGLRDIARQKRDAEASR